MVGFYTPNKKKNQKYSSLKKAECVVTDRDYAFMIVDGEGDEPQAVHISRVLELLEDDVTTPPILIIIYRKVIEWFNT